MLADDQTTTCDIVTSDSACEAAADSLGKGFEKGSYGGNAGCYGYTSESENADKLYFGTNEGATKDKHSKVTATATQRRICTVQSGQPPMSSNVVCM